MDEITPLTRHIVHHGFREAPAIELCTDTEQIIGNIWESCSDLAYNLCYQSLLLFMPWHESISKAEIILSIYQLFIVIESYPWHSWNTGKYCYPVLFLLIYRSIYISEIPLSIYFSICLCEIPHVHRYPATTMIYYSSRHILPVFRIG